MHTCSFKEDLDYYSYYLARITPRYLHMYTFNISQTLKRYMCKKWWLISIKNVYLFNLLIKSCRRKHCIASVTTSSTFVVYSGTVVYDVHKHITNVPRLSKSLVNNNKLRGYGWVHNLNSNAIIHCHFNPTIYKYYSVNYQPCKHAAAPSL